MTATRPPDEAADPPARVLPPDAVTVRCREHGPLVVEMPTGDAFQGLRLRVTDHEGREFALPTGKKAVALCRCGQSESRPFCDGSHKKCGFQAAERAPD
jgi:CDGSH-type Zn-finger protein